MSRIALWFRLYAACLFCSWAIDLTPKTDIATKLALAKALQAMIDDDARRQS
jgi:hypothetical protein